MKRARSGDVMTKRMARHVVSLKKAAKQANQSRRPPVEETKQDAPLSYMFVMPQLVRTAAGEAELARRQELATTVMLAPSQADALLRKATRTYQIAELSAWFRTATHQTDRRLYLQKKKPTDFVDLFGQSQVDALAAFDDDPVHGQRPELFGFFAAQHFSPLPNCVFFEGQGQRPLHDFDDVIKLITKLTQSDEWRKQGGAALDTVRKACVGHSMHRGRPTLATWHPNVALAEGRSLSASDVAVVVVLHVNARDRIAALPVEQLCESSLATHKCSVALQPGVWLHVTGVDFTPSVQRHEVQQYDALVEQTVGVFAIHVRVTTSA